MPRGRSFAKPDDRRLQTKRRDTDKPDSEGDDTSLERATKKGSKRNIPFSRRRENLVIPVTRECELMTYLLEKLKDKNKNNIKSLLKDRQVIVNNLSVSVYNHKLNPGDRLEITPLKKMAAKSLKGFSILYEDDHIIVIDKHSGVLSIADNRTSLSAYSLLSTHVKMQHPSNKIFVVHRLDRETSGLMMFAKSEEVQQIMQESWYDLVTERSYAAVVEGKIEPAEGSITSFLTESKDMVVYSTHNEELGKKAITFYSTVKSNEKYSLVKATLETGRKNQVRVHLKDLGHSIVGDKKYGSKSNPIGRLALHAWVFSFIHPVTRAQLKFENNLPRKFAHLI
jgi:23S rRNA pseudouridine1911/1915/1917 synthase